MKLYVIGIGPGGGEDMTLRAVNALKACDTLVGYPVYVDLVKPLFEGERVLTTPMKREIERCTMAVEQALAGHTVAMVCSGDAGVYGMAGLILEVAKGHPELDVEIVPGVTAALSGAAVLGAPLAHDFAVISLSDLLTPWETIAARLRAAAQADFAVCLYNPASKKRADYLHRACEILLETKSPQTVCAIVRNIGRQGESSRILTLEQLSQTSADMFTTVFIGNSMTKVVGGKMVTPRGYEARGTL